MNLEVNARFSGNREALGGNAFILLKRKLKNSPVPITLTFLILQVPTVHLDYLYGYYDWELDYLHGYYDWELDYMYGYYDWELDYLHGYYDWNAVWSHNVHSGNTMCCALKGFYTTLCFHNHTEYHGQLIMRLRSACSPLSQAEISASCALRSPTRTNLSPSTIRTHVPGDR
jgi:hypothetical protein